MSETKEITALKMCLGALEASRALISDETKKGGKTWTLTAIRIAIETANEVLAKATTP